MQSKEKVMTPEQTLDWLAEQHKSQCNEDRPVQEWIRSMKSMLPAPVQDVPETDFGNMTKDEALDMALEALEESVDLVREDYENAKKLYGNYPSRQARLLGMEDGLLKHEAAITAIKQARSAPVQEPLSELEKDAANLLFALHDAWPYVHGHCTIESRKKAIQALMVKHGDFADLHPPAAQRQWVGLTDEEIQTTWDSVMDGAVFTRREIYKAIEAKLKEKNG
jgi:hypothetical protein